MFISTYFNKHTLNDQLNDTFNLFLMYLLRVLRTNTNDILLRSTYILLSQPVSVELKHTSFKHIMFGNKCERQHNSYMYTLPT